MRSDISSTQQPHSSGSLKIINHRAILFAANSPRHEQILNAAFVTPLRGHRPKGLGIHKQPELKLHPTRTKLLLSGVTLVELLIMLAITAILLITAIPTFADMLERYRVKAATEKLFLYLHHAKSEAIKRNQRIHLTFNSTNSGAVWCYGLKINAACDCTIEGSCQINGAQKVINSSEFTGVSIETHISFPGNHFIFENVRWIMASTYGHVRFISSREKQARVIVSSMGRIRTCSPYGSANIPGYSTSC